MWLKLEGSEDSRHIEEYFIHFNLLEEGIEYVFERFVRAVYDRTIVVRGRPKFAEPQMKTLQ